MAALSARRPRPTLPATLHAFASSLLEFALPQRCAGCGAPARAAAALCADCRLRLGRLAVTVCARCLLAGGEGHGCAAHPGHRVHVAWGYDARARAFVHALKFGARPILARYAGRELARGLPRARRRFDLVVPVPLHAARRRERGFDQAEAIAAALARRLPAPLLRDALCRVRATAPQSAQPAARRRQGLAGAFEVPEPAQVRGRRVLLVDDVLTTGATLEAARAVLRDAGAEVEAAALAWAGPA